MVIALKKKPNCDMMIINSLHGSKIFQWYVITMFSRYYKFHKY
jgi:hypothetical protein